MVWLLALIFAAVAAAAPQRKPPPPRLQPWETALMEYVCTDQQMRRVEAESTFCRQHTKFFSTYCYGSAFIRNCDKRGPDEERVRGAMP